MAVAADGVNDPGYLEPEDGRLGQREDPVEVAATDLEVRRANARNTNLDPHLRRRRFRPWNVFPSKNIRGAIFS
jgi:hypothetical protein